MLTSWTDEGYVLFQYTFLFCIGRSMKNLKEMKYESMKKGRHIFFDPDGTPLAYVLVNNTHGRRGHNK
jgi:hypothetical protein